MNVSNPAIILFLFWSITWRALAICSKCNWILPKWNCFKTKAFDVLIGSKLLHLSRCTSAHNQHVPRVFRIEIYDCLEFSQDLWLVLAERKPLFNIPCPLCCFYWTKCALWGSPGCQNMNATYETCDYTRENGRWNIITCSTYLYVTYFIFWIFRVKVLSCNFVES